MLQRFFQEIRTDDFLSRDIVDWKIFPPGKPRFVSPGEHLDANGLYWLSRLNIPKLYSHQAQALKLIEKGENTVVATPTASGKSLIYMLPLLQRAVSENKRGLLLFPLKALARDQLQGVINAARKTSLSSPEKIAVYDGDTSQAERRRIRENPPRILLTNPDMLHYALLPYHHLWADFFRDLSLLVVDEVHTYRGVMGTNMAWVFRRLQRVCAHYQSCPQYIFCSATIANPVQLSSELTGKKARGITENGAGKAKRHYILFNPYEGPIPPVLSLLEKAVRLGLRTIVYTQSRKMTELIAIWAGQRDREFRQRIQAYRAGFLPSDRRDIEKKLASGELLAIVSTSALELGIDIGDLDVCILVGYPGSIMSILQRAGRVGRQGREAAIFLVAHEDALDQYFMRHPRTLFTSQPENAVINPENREISGRHLVCAAADLPLERGEAILDFAGSKAVLSELLQSGRLLVDSEEHFYFSPGKYPHRDVDLRGAGCSFSVFERESGKMIGTVDGIRAMHETHPGAVYLHMGRTYLVDDLDMEKKTVSIRAHKANYFTRVMTEKSTQIEETIKSKPLGGARLGWGRLRVTERVIGYEKRLVRGQKLIGRVELDLPEQVFTTQGMWLEIPANVRRKTEAEEMHFMGGIHALEHVLIAVIPFFVLVDRNDLGGISIPYHAQLENAGVFVYDGIAGGVGLTRQAYELAQSLIDRALNIMRDCECTNGCPACVHSPKCGSGNRPLDKAAALGMLEMIQHGKEPEEKKMKAGSMQKGPEMNDSELSVHSRVRNAVHYAVLDIETRRSAKEVGGWHRAARMGVSCAVVYDSACNDCLTFYQEDIPRLAEFLRKVDLVIGFNIQKFDYQVLSGILQFPWNELPTLDILVEVHSVLGFRLSLDHLAGQTLGVGKTADGLMALKWWKEGKLDKIVEYCRQDVIVTRDLYRFGLQNGYLLYKNKAGKCVRVPSKWVAA